MHSKLMDLPVIFEMGSAFTRDLEWGDMNVAYESFPAGTDSSQAFKGLPDDKCQCPHWGYVLKGKMLVKYRGHEEVVSAGETYYLAPGHSVVTLEDCELIEFSPKGEYQKTLEVVKRNMNM